MKRPHLLEAMAKAALYDIGAFPTYNTEQEREDQERDIVNFLYHRAFDHTDTKEVSELAIMCINDELQATGMKVKVEVVAQAYAEYAASVLAHFVSIKPSTNTYYVVTYHSDMYRALQACPSYLNPFRALWRALCAYVVTCMKAMLGDVLNLTLPYSTKWIADAIHEIHDELNCTLRLYGFGIGDGAPDNVNNETYWQGYREAAKQQRKVSAFVSRPEFAHIVATRSDWAKQPGYAGIFSLSDKMVEHGDLVSSVRK